MISSVIVVAACDVIPPRNLTLTRMWVTKRRIVLYATTVGRLPADLGAIPELAGKDNNVTDAWGLSLIHI